MSAEPIANPAGADVQGAREAGARQSPFDRFVEFVADQTGGVATEPRALVFPHDDPEDVTVYKFAEPLDPGYYGGSLSLDDVQWLASPEADEPEDGGGAFSDTSRYPTIADDESIQFEHDVRRIFYTRFLSVTPDDQLVITDGLSRGYYSLEEEDQGRLREVMQKIVPTVDEQGEPIPSEVTITTVLNNLWC